MPAAAGLLAAKQSRKRLSGIAGTAPAGTRPGESSPPRVWPPEAPIPGEHIRRPGDGRRNIGASTILAIKPDLDHPPGAFAPHLAQCGSARHGESASPRVTAYSKDTHAGDSFGRPRDAGQQVLQRKTVSRPGPAETPDLSGLAARGRVALPRTRCRGADMRPPAGRPASTNSKAGRSDGLAGAPSPGEAQPPPPYRTPHDSTADIRGFDPLYAAEVSPSEAGSRVFSAGKPVLRSRRELRAEPRFGRQVPINEAVPRARPFRRTAEAAAGEKRLGNPQVNAPLRRYGTRTQATG